MESQFGFGLPAGQNQPALFLCLLTAACSAEISRRPFHNTAIKHDHLLTSEYQAVVKVSLLWSVEKLVIQYSESPVCSSASVLRHHYFLGTAGTKTLFMWTSPGTYLQVGAIRTYYRQSGYMINMAYDYMINMAQSGYMKNMASGVAKGRLGVNCSRYHTLSGCCGGAFWTG